MTIKKLILLPLFSLLCLSSARGATLTVCSAGCTYVTAQAALDASSNGDTLILAAGQNFGDLTIPGGRHDLTIKSSSIDAYPRNTRIVRRSPALAHLNTITAGSFSGWMTGTPGIATLTSTWGGTAPLTPRAHGLKVGDKVAIGGSRYSAYHCATLDQPPYTSGACDASRVGYFNIRTFTHLANGHVLYFKGRNLPPPLLEHMPYYVVNFGAGGNDVRSAGTNPDKFQIATTLGGAPLIIPQFNPYGTELVIEDHPLPQAMQDTMYVVSVPSPLMLELSPTPGGAPVVWSQIPFSYNGGGFSVGFSFVKIAPVYNLTFDGIEVLTLDRNVYYPFVISNQAGNAEGENYNIHILRSWIHGPGDQKDFPMTLLNIGGHDLEIGWNIFEGAYSTANDTQNIGFMSTRNVDIHDNELKGATEGILSGGNFPWFAFQTNTTGIKVARNYLWKPLNVYIGIAAVYLSPTQFQLLSRSANADCASVANNPNLGHQCFAYEGEGERCDPAGPPVSRFIWNQPASQSIFTVTGSLAGQEGDLYVLNGVIHMDYNFSGSVTCPGGVRCTAVANPAFPSGSTRLGIALLGSNGTGDNFFDSSTFYGQNRNAWSKNLLESKYGDHWDIEGNVFSGQDNCDAGATCQDPAIQFTVAGNGSGLGDPVNYLVSSSSSIIHNNIFEHLSAGIVGVGKTFAGNFGGVGFSYEFAGFGQNINNLVENNLFIDLGSTEYSSVYGGAVVRTQDTENWTIQHNTAVDVRIGFITNRGKSMNYNSNILVPYQNACPGGFCSTPAPTSDVGVQNDYGLPLAYVGGDGAGSWYRAVRDGLVDANSSFNNNLVMNRSGYTVETARGANYPTSTYLIEPSDAGRDPNLLFANWTAGGAAPLPDGCLYQQGDYRLAGGKSALYPSSDGSPIGANIDAIEAFTGANGNGVAKGGPAPASWTPPLLNWPAFAPLNRSLTLNYGDDPVAHVMWDFSPMTAVASSHGNFSPRTSGASGTVSFTTPSGTMNPAQQGLSLGAYHVTVQLQDAQGIVQTQATRDITFVSADLSGVKVYPNPWRKDKHAAKNVTFANLPIGSTIKLFTVSSHLVKEYGPPATGSGTSSWDLTNDSGEKVASGVYVYVVTDAEGNKIKGKLAIIR